MSENHQNMVEKNGIEVQGRFVRASTRAYINKHYKLCARLTKVNAKFENVRCTNMLICDASCKNPSCELSSLHRCSRCLLVSYCSLQCSHLCWKEHKQLCDREAAARKVRKEQRVIRKEQMVRRKEQRAVRKVEKVGNENATIQEVD